MARPEYDRFRNALESLVERTVDALERGRDEVLREAKVGKVRLLDIYQLRRERGRLYQRLGEEVYGLVRKGALEIPSVGRTLAKLAALDDKIGAKEQEVDKLKMLEDELVADATIPRLKRKKKSPPKAESKGEPQAKKKKTKRKRKKRTLGDDDA